MSEKERKQQSFLHGSFVLIVATALAKIIGAVYRIPLTNLLGTRGMGFYSTAYDLYVPMYSIAMAGLPIAISRIVAEYAASGRYKDVKKILKVSRFMFFITGSVGFILMICLAFLLTGNHSISLFGYTLNFHAFNSGALRSILSIAPALIFCCIMSAYRGYYEGLSNMTPTGISEVLEAIGKLIFGYGIAYVVLAKTGDYSYAAAGALMGVSIGTALGAGYLIFKYRVLGQHGIPSSLMNTSPDASSGKKLARAIVIVAIPVVLGSLVNNVTSLIDVVMVQKQLAGAISKAPAYFETRYAALIATEMADDKTFTVLKDLPNSLYGCHRGYAFSIYNLIPVLTSTLGVSAIPVLATAWTKRDKKAIKSNIQTMIRTVAVIAMPCGAGIFALSGGILSLLYSNSQAIAIAAPNLRILGICAIFAGINAPLVNMLQAIGKERTPLKNIAVGAVVKIIVNFILVGTPQINILGVPIGTTACYAYICIANFISLIKYSSVKPDMVSILIKPFLSGAICGIAAYATNLLLSATGLSSRLTVVISIVAAGAVYLVALAVLKVVERDDVLSLPKGEKLLRVCLKLKIVH